MQFEFTTAAKIIFGPGMLNILGDLIHNLGNRILVITGAPAEINERLQGLLDAHGISRSMIQVSGEPTVESVEAVLIRARQEIPDVVIGIGGGSAIDSAKTVAVMLTNPGKLTDYLEVIGQNQSLSNLALPLIAIPTTAGTGSEVTRNAVIGSPAHHVKVSLRSPYLLPKTALIDPELTLSVTPEITAYTGMDALTQLIEPYTCNTPNPMTDALAVEGVQHLAHSFARAYDDGQYLPAREDMSLASLFSGLALANSRLGAVHGLAGPIGGEIEAHHGAICAALLPNVIDANIKALLDRSTDHPALARYTRLARILIGAEQATVSDLVRWIRETCQHMKIQSLGKLGLLQSQFPDIIAKALKANSMRGNPITLSEGELRNILQSSL